MHGGFVNPASRAGNQLHARLSRTAPHGARERLRFRVNMSGPHNSQAALGAFCSGGTIANVTALWVARNRLFAPDGTFRGIAQEEHTSLSLGINPDRIAALSMGFGSALGAFAAIVILPLGTITVDGGYDVLINALSVCIVGGLGSTFGVIIAAFIIGYAQTLTSMYISEHWVMIVRLLAILVILGHQKELEERV